jgi:hypothetical protein
MNELDIPEVGVGPEGQFEVKCGNRNFVIRYVVNIRTGADLEMVNETIQHFKHGIDIAARGFDKVSSQLPPRASYTKKDVHRESCVSIWTRNSFAVVPDFDLGHIYKVPVNICNEYTSGQMLVDQLLLAAEIMKHNFDDCMEAGSIIDVNSTAARKKRVDPAAPKDLAKEFPRQAKQQAVAPPQQQTEDVHPLARKSAGGKVEIIHLGDYDYKLREEYEQEFAGSGKWISFDISKLWRHIAARNDGAGTYECIDVYSFFNGMPAKYEMGVARMFPPKPDAKFPNDWQNLFDKFITDGRLAQPGTYWEQPMVISWGLSIGKKDGKVYWNLKNIEIAGDYIPDDDYPPEPDWANMEEPPWVEDDEVNEADVDFMG